MSQYLVCDLDDCLIKTDLLYEQWLTLLKKKPHFFFISLLWLLKGRAYLKSQLTYHTSLHAHLLPYRHEVLDVLKEWRHRQRGPIVLASASPQQWVSEIANHLGLFEIALGSTSEKNLKGPNKMTAVRKLVGNASFTYIGDSFADVALWKEAQQIIAVNPSAALAPSIHSLKKEIKLINDKKNQLRLLFKQLRPHQWVKNALVFLPLLAGHKIFNAAALTQGAVAFAGFSLAASFVYVLNDLLDLPSDRNHHTKKNRPFASGDLSVKWGLLLLPILMIGVIGISWFLPFEFALTIAIYFTLNLAYSFYLKQQVILDIISLSMMYTLRIFAGSTATGIEVSEWLLSFSTLFFFSLACIKRCTEIVRSKTKLTIDGRGYRQVDSIMIQILGVGSGLISVVIVLLYLQSVDVRKLYSHPQVLWFTTPLLLYWISRIWLLTNRDQIHDDPVVYAIKDRTSWVCLLLILGVLGLAV